MAKNELLPFADGEDANVLPTNQWEALTDILENGFQSGIARSEQVNRVLAQGAVASYVLGQLIVDQLNKDATLDKSALYQNLILALQENAKDACLPLSGGNVTGNLTVQNKNVLRSVNGTSADANGNVTISLPSPKAYVTEAWKSSDGLSWYRKWSDGWIEQGYNEPKKGSPHNFTYPISFTTTTYFLLPLCYIPVGSGGQYWQNAITSKTTTGCTITSHPSALVSYYACGY